MNDLQRGNRAEDATARLVCENNIVRSKAGVSMKVIVAIDQSKYSEQITDAIISRRWPPDTVFKVLTVLQPPACDEDSSPGWKHCLMEIFDKQKDCAEEILLAARKKISDNIGDCTVHTEVRKGSPRGQIILAAADWMADKIVVGAHGRSPNRLLGTVPRSVAEHAHCSVELIRLHALHGETEEILNRETVAVKN